MTARKPKAPELQAEVEEVEPPYLETPEAEDEYTSADEWLARDDGGADLTLPSGARVRVVQPPIGLMQMRGEIPPYLTATTRKHIADGKPWTFKESQWLIDWLISVSVTSVKVSMARRADAVFVGDISDADKNTLVTTLSLQILAGALQ